MTAQNVTAIATVGVLTTQVPVRIREIYRCKEDGAESTVLQDNTIVAQTRGVLNLVSSELKTEYGPSVPIDPQSIIPQANATCASNPVCRMMGIKVGNCCPRDDGVYNPCCSFCAFKPACTDWAVDDASMCCPSKTNIMNKCCD